MIDKLHEELNAILAEMEPLKVKERAVRAKIKEASDIKYMNEMPAGVARRKTKLAGMEAGTEEYVALLSDINHIEAHIAFLKSKYA